MAFRFPGRPDQTDHLIPVAEIPAAKLRLGNVYIFRIDLIILAEKTDPLALDLKDPAPDLFPFLQAFRVADLDRQVVFFEPIGIGNIHISRNFTQLGKGCIF